jgi:hypothetical protein
MNIVLLTISPADSAARRFWRRFKNFVRNHFFFYGGPQSVLDSLTRGFKSLKVDYKLNPKTGGIPEGSVVGVLSNVDALKWAIQAKKAGQIKKIVAGPNLMILPTDGGRILFDKNIDAILLPSEWVKNFWLSLAPELGAKIRIWPAGVEIPPVSDKPKIGCLIYKKRVDEKLFLAIIKRLKDRNIGYKILNYGRYKREDYFELLDKSEFMIYFSESESQGLALIEAWMRDVPILARNRGFWEWKNYRWEAENISAPYLTNDCGIFFKDEEDFSGRLSFFLEKLKSGQFQPRQYALKNFSDEIAAKNYLKFTE